MFGKKIVSLLTVCGMLSLSSCGKKSGGSGGFTPPTPSQGGANDSGGESAQHSEVLSLLANTNHSLDRYPCKIHFELGSYVQNELEYNYYYICQSFGQMQRESGKLSLVEKGTVIEMGTATSTKDTIIFKAKKTSCAGLTYVEDYLYDMTVMEAGNTKSLSIKKQGGDYASEISFSTESSSVSSNISSYDVGCFSTDGEFVENSFSDNVQ